MPKASINMARLEIHKSAIISEIEDNNVFHFLSKEILNLILLKSLAGLDFARTALFLKNFQFNDTTNIWRLEVLKLLGFPQIFLGNVTTTELYKTAHRIPRNPRWVIDNSPNLANARRNDLFIDCFRQMTIGVREEIDLLFVSRSKSRLLFDNRSGDRAEDRLSELSNGSNLTYRCVDLDQLSPSDQFTMFRSARNILAVHGAGLTNIVFCNPDARVWELNFRRLFPCDPLCDDHFRSLKTFHTPCNSSRLFSEFHKLDYLKLSRIFGLAYTELDIEDCKEPMDRNPINVRSVFVDVDSVMNQILSIN